MTEEVYDKRADHHGQVIHRHDERKGQRSGTRRGDGRRLVVNDRLHDPIALSLIHIWLSIAKGSETYAQNVPMTYDGTAFTAADLLWYNDSNEKSTLTAYHPYSEQGRCV